MTSDPINLEDVSVEEFRQFINSFDYVLSDCDGVIWHVDPYPGVGDFFKLMKKNGKRVYYVSNNSLRNEEAYISKFKASGIENGIENLTYPSTAIAEYLKSKNFNKKVFCVASEQTRITLEENGFQCKEGPDVGTGFYSEYAKYLVDDPEIGAVVFDSDFKINLPKMYMATAYLQRPDVLYLSGATDRWVPIRKDIKAVGVGQFTDMVSEAVNRQPIVLAKPGKLYADFILQRSGIKDPSRVLFIGDMIAQDIAFGKVAGFKTLLILTHHTYEEMMNQDINKPDFYARSLGDIVPQLNKL